MLQDRISLPFLAQSLRKSRTTILPINFFWTYNFLFHFDDSLSFKTKGARNNCSFCRFQVFISLKKCSFFIICTPLNIHVVSENLVQTSLFLSIIISLGNVKGTDKSVASVFLCEARCLLFKSLFPMYAAFRYSLSENHLYFMYFMFSLFSQDQNNSFLLNIFFAHIVPRLFAN